MAIIELLGSRYEISKLTGREQIHIVRRLAPFMKSFLPLVQKMIPETVASVETSHTLSLIGGIDFFDFAAGAIDALGAMPQIDCDYIIDHCLDGAVKRYQDGGAGFTAIRERGMSRFFFDDITNSGALQMRLTAAVIMENLANFFSEFQQMFPEISGTATDSQSSSASPSPNGMTGISALPAGPTISARTPN